MNETTSHRPNRSPRVATNATAKVLTGLRVVLQGGERRAAVLRCLSSARWLALRGAEVVLACNWGNSPGWAADRGLVEAVAQRFPWVRVLPGRGEDSGGFGAEDLLPMAAPRWELHVSADVELQCHSVEALLRELEEAPAGTILVPGLRGPDGRALAVGIGAWAAHGSRATLEERAPSAVRSAVPSVGADFIVPRPDEFLAHEQRRQSGRVNHSATLPQRRHHSASRATRCR